ncbi:MAG: hypothetical protein JWR80_7480 [Bradyrhizobium sp.]|nr:hypothetical protein [Bradyrhizobium sp.]
MELHRVRSREIGYGDAEVIFDVSVEVIGPFIMLLNRRVRKNLGWRASREQG